MPENSGEKSLVREREGVSENRARKWEIAKNEGHSGKKKIKSKCCKFGAPFKWDTSVLIADQTDFHVIWFNKKRKYDFIKFAALFCLPFPMIGHWHGFGARFWILNRDWKKIGRKSDASCVIFRYQKAVDLWANGNERVGYLTPSTQRVSFISNPSIFIQRPNELFSRLIRNYYQ